jgi:4-amino-4-deoxy-L-arabinose transferase-like glycosyltransferase
VLTRQTAAAGLAAALAVRDHVPLLYWLTTLALRLLPEHEVTLRLVSALAGVLAVPGMIALGRVVGRPRAGLWAALLLAVSPFAIRYSQEARHYSLLLLFGLLATVLLLRALGRGGRRDWLAYGLAAALALLTHYSAWLLLLAQGAMVAGWLLGRLRAEGRGAAARLAPAAAVVGAVLLLLAPGAAEAIRANTAAAAGTTAAAPLAVWLRELWLEFGFGRAAPALLLALAAAGGALSLLRRRPAAAALLLVSAVAPVLLIQVLGISRFALPKYVIYLLPITLFAAGAGVEVVVGWWSWVVGRGSLAGGQPSAVSRRLASSVMAAAILLIAWLPVAEEYPRMVHDWRGAAAALGTAAPGDVVLLVALDTGDGFNAAGVVAPTYLDPGFRLIDGNHLTAGEAAALTGARGRVSALALNLYGPVTVVDGRWVAANHQGSLYSLARVAHADAAGASHFLAWVAPSGSGGENVRRTAERATHREDVLEQVAALYAQLIPQAIPAAACDLGLRLAYVQLARGDSGAAEAALAGRAPDCPANADARAATTAVGQAQLAEALAAGDTATADRLAAALLADDPRDTAALAVLTVADVLALLAAGELTIDAGGAPEPVEARRFTMPADGDAADVLFTHPPAAASFTVALPNEPTVLQFRVANDPQSWAWGGDGVTFVVTAQAAGEATRELYRQHAGNDDAGRGWHAVALPLDAFAGQTVTITLATEAGPAGDGTGDWAGWDSPRVVRRGE